METFLQQIANGVVVGSMYALLALGYTMVYGVLNMINFAHGDVLMIGGLVGVAVIHFLQGAAPALPGGIQLLIAALMAIPVCVGVNLLIERVAYRPLRNSSRLTPLISGIAVSVLLQTFAMLVFGRQPLIYPALFSLQPYEIGPVRISQTQIMVLALAAVLMISLVVLVEKTRIGRGMRAVAENPRVAVLMGVDPNVMVILAFAVGAALAAVAGVMWGASYATAHFSMGFLPGLKAFACAVLGGIGNIYGAVAGGLMLGLLESLGSGYLGSLTGGLLGSQYQDIFAFIVLNLVLVLRPGGIFGKGSTDRA